MQLLDPFWFRDPDGVVWDAPLDSVIDGASIPKALWSTVGSPYTGSYRRASIVHDIACERATGDVGKRRTADRMFYHACRAGGCSVAEATLLYVGVRIGGHWAAVPAWKAASPTAAGPRLQRPAADKRVEADFQTAAEAVLAAGPTDDVFEIERRTDAALSVAAGTDLSGR